MVNASLTYEILMYLNSFYFGMFATCELGMETLKINQLPYTTNNKISEISVLVGLCILESIRIHLGRKGSLSDHGWQVILSVFITIPCAAGVVFLAFRQTHTLKLEYILCALMLLLQFTELIFATLFFFSLCKTPTYD